VSEAAGKKKRIDLREKPTPRPEARLRHRGIIEGPVSAGKGGAPGEGGGGVPIKLSGTKRIESTKWEGGRLTSWAETLLGLLGEPGGS